MSPLTASVYAEKPFIFDLTSDTATIPTDEMFDIMKAATRGDDVYQVILTYRTKLNRTNPLKNI